MARGIIVSAVVALVIYEGTCSGAMPPAVTAAPAELEARVAAAGRPRLLLSSSKLTGLRAAITTTHREQWEHLKQVVDAALDEPPPDYRGIQLNPTRPGTADDEMLWQREFGAKLPGMTLVALLDPDPKYFSLVRRWALQAAAYPHWGGGLFDGTGLAASHQLYGLAIAYDYLYHRWSEEDREILRRTLAVRGRVLYEAGAGTDPRGGWRAGWRTNYTWHMYKGLGMAAIALAGDEPGVGEWLQFTLNALHKIATRLPQDGGQEEGPFYWGYGMEALTRLTAAFQPFGWDYTQLPYFQNAPLFRLYLSGPDIQQIAGLGDGHPLDESAIRPIMYWLASLHHDPVAQWLAEKLPTHRVFGQWWEHDLDAEFHSLLWYDPSLNPELPPNLSRWHVFPDTGLAAARTGWEPDAMTLHLRSGATLVPHAHLDVNNFLVNAAGEWLLRDYGYGKVGANYWDWDPVYFNRSTYAHNCLVIGGKHQFRNEEIGGRIIGARELDGVIWFKSDATPVYAGAESVVRELALVTSRDPVLPWGFIIIRDRARTVEEENFDFLLQPGGKVHLGADQFVIAGGKVRLVGHVIAPVGAKLDLNDGENSGEPMNVEGAQTLRISAPWKSREVEFTLVLIPVRAGATAPEVRAVEGSPDLLQVGDHLFTLSSEGDPPVRLTRTK